MWWVPRKALTQRALLLLADWMKKSAIAWITCWRLGAARFVRHFWVWNILVALLSLCHFWVCKISVALWLWVQYFSGTFGSAIFFVALFGLQDFGEGSPPLWDFLLTGDGSHAKHLQRVWLRGGGKTMQIVPKKSSLQNDWENNITSNK